MSPYSPLVCAEGEERQVAGILHVADLEILETVTYSYGILDLVGGQFDGLVPIAATLLPEVLGLGGVEDPVLTGNLETLDVLEGGIGVIVIIQMDVDGIVLDVHILEGRTLIEDALEAIVTVQCCKGQSFTHLLFLGRMDLTVLVRIDEVIDADETAVGDDLCGLELLLAQQSTAEGIVVIVIAEGRYLNEVEGNLTQAELFSPLVHQQFQTLGLLVARIAYIRTALIEEDTFHGVVQDGVEGAIAPEQ